MRFLNLSVMCFILLAPNLINAAGSQPYSYDLSDIKNEDEVNHIDIYDPYERVNRIIFYFDKSIDTMFLEPVAKSYHLFIPEWGRNRIGNFLTNLGEPVRIFNAIFQGDVDMLANSLGRFLTNTILGIGGLFDVAATQENLKLVDTDFGLTLRKYGATSGPYLMLPILGPSSFRDATGKVVDSLLDPFNYGWLHSDVRIIRQAAYLVYKREEMLETLHSIEETSLDEYASIRSIYMQKRK